MKALLQNILIESRIHGSINKQVVKQLQMIKLPLPPPPYLTHGMMLLLWNKHWVSVLLANVRQAFVFFVVSSGLCLVQGFYFCPVSSLFWKNEHWPWVIQVRPFRCPSGFSCDFLDYLSKYSWRNFGGLSTNGKVVHCFKFSPFVGNSLLESQNLILSNPFQMETSMPLFCIFMVIIVWLMK